MFDIKNNLNEIDKKIMANLKDFQKATVERVDELFRVEKKRRVLISDEVGLGKTLIARGVIAKFAKLRNEEHDDLVKVVYICSNSAIAQQNMAKLKISSEIQIDEMSSSRLSMQHLNIFNTEYDEEILRKYIQLIPLTPDTSFKISSSPGTASERMLIFVFLSKIDDLKQYKICLKEILKGTAEKGWNDALQKYYEEAINKCDKRSSGEYFKYMIPKIMEGLKEKQNDGTTLYDKLIELCSTKEKSERKGVNKFIGQLRILFSKISVERLNPDLVIMDEFQRFKTLLEQKEVSETTILSNKFFNSKGTRILLLSATPYKMYCTLEEIDESDVDEHYQEFLKVMNFLNDNQESKSEFKEIWKDYSVKLKELSLGDTALIEAKNLAEDALYKTVCRTERVSAVESKDIIDDKSVHTPLSISESDIKSYVCAQKLFDDLEMNINVPIDYIKSTPYILSFMRDYQLKQKLENYYCDETHFSKINVANKKELWLERKKINNYSDIPSKNAKLEALKKEAFQNNSDLLLWIPPSMPYYETNGIYKNAKNFSKILIFSSWEMVPRMIASMISYEAERRSVWKLAERKGDQIFYFNNNTDENISETSTLSRKKRYPSPRLIFAFNDNEFKGMNLFALLYPSSFLTDVYNPIVCFNEHMSLEQISKSIKGAIELALSKIESNPNGPIDRRWYFMAPILLDDPEAFQKWIKDRGHLIDIDGSNIGGANNASGIEKHMNELISLREKILNREELLGKKPDDLLDVLADLAIASPSICIKRSYAKYLTNDSIYKEIYSSEIAKLFLARMNTPEATAVVELCYEKSTAPHWRNLLSYCKEGNLQAVFDEYTHMLSSGLEKDKFLVDNLHSMINSSMNIKTTLYSVDTFKEFKKRIEEKIKEKEGIKVSKSKNKNNLRSHFAVAFTKGEGTNEQNTDRKRIVRNAFNSPFRPFVLASTSIGQEGLDFHFYCRKIMHWNLPSNPIDIEQREGRINRFECLAIRQNIVEQYGAGKFNKDVWTEMFDKATEENENNKRSSDLIPFWSVANVKDMIKIERIVPLYPFSKDIASYERLIKILSLYRLTLGQARQEELLQYLIEKSDNSKLLKEMFINLSPHYKKKQND